MRGNHCVHHVAALLLVSVYSERYGGVSALDAAECEGHNYVSGDR